MVQIENYLNDGANWQARAVLAVLLGKKQEVEAECDGHEIEITVGRFENCREQGYVFCLMADYRILKYYAVYEHRNSDQLIVLGNCNISPLNTPNADEMFGGRGKYDYDIAFHCGEIERCANYVISDMITVANRFAESEKQNYSPR